MLQCLNACVQRLGCVLGLHRDTFLKDDGPCVDPRVHKVNRATAHFDASIDGLLWSVNAWKRRAQGRVRIEYAIGECVDKDWAENAHKARQNDRFDLVFPKCCEEGGLKCVSGGKLSMVDDEGLYPGRLAALNRFHVWTIGDNER